MKQISKLIIILLLFGLVSCDQSNRNKRFESEMLLYTSSYNEFGSRVEVYSDYIKLVVWYRPDQSEERAKRFLASLKSKIEMKMNTGKRYKERPINAELRRLEPGDFY